MFSWMGRIFNREAKVKEPFGICGSLKIWVQRERIEAKLVNDYDLMVVGFNREQGRDKIRNSDIVDMVYYNNASNQSNTIEINTEQISIVDNKLIIGDGGYNDVINIELDNISKRTNICEFWLAIKSYKRFGDIQDTSDLRLVVTNENKYGRRIIVYSSCQFTRNSEWQAICKIKYNKKSMRWSIIAGNDGGIGENRKDKSTEI